MFQRFQQRLDRFGKIAPEAKKISRALRFGTQHVIVQYYRKKNNTILLFYRKRSMMQRKRNVRKDLVLQLIQR